MIAGAGFCMMAWQLAHRREFIGRGTFAKNYAEILLMAELYFEINRQTGLCPTVKL